MAKYEIYTESRAETLSTGQAIAGAACVILNAVSLIAGATYAAVCHGFWGGMMVSNIFIKLVISFRILFGLAYHINFI